MTKVRRFYALDVMPAHSASKTRVNANAKGLGQPAVDLALDYARAAIGVEPPSSLTIGADRSCAHASSRSRRSPKPCAATFIVIVGFLSHGGPPTFNPPTSLLAYFRVYKRGYSRLSPSHYYPYI